MDSNEKKGKRPRIGARPYTVDSHDGGVRDNSSNDYASSAESNSEGQSQNTYSSQSYGDRQQRPYQPRNNYNRQGGYQNNRYGNQGGYQIYKNGSLAKPSELRPYDVATYSHATNTIRVCDNRLSGYYESCTPSPDEPKEIVLMGHKFPVLTTAQVDEALAAGAKFIVTPGLDPDIVKYCQSKNLPIFPGCTTPTDYHTAYKLGLEVLKFFPAEQSGGLAKIKAMSAPFPMFKVMPTGGISLKNLAEYIKAPVICACGGSYMVTADLIDNNKWDEITELCKKSVEIVKEARNNG